MRSLKLTLALTFLAGTTAYAETRHVATTGDDAAAGTAAAPWRSLQRAADAAAPGDTVIIHAGTYFGMVIDRSGTEAAPIAFVGEGSPTIDGAQSGNRDAIAIEGGNWIRIEGLNVIGATRAGIGALDCSHITVKNNRIDNNGRWGVFSGFCDDLLVEGNEVSRSGTEHGIYASNSADRPVIRNNTIWGNAQCGVHLNGDVSYGGDGVISNAIVENNIIRDNGRSGGSGINGDGLVGAMIRNNVLDNNHASGISLYMIDGGAPSTGNQVVNNTVRMAADARWAVNIQDGSSGNIIRNNILLHLSASRGAIDICSTCTSAMQSDHNAVTGKFSLDGTFIDLAAWRAQTGSDAASFVATAAQLFTAPTTGDLSLRADSPAIDQGMAPGAPETDILGNARPQRGAVDIGAYEYCEGSMCATGGGGAGPGSPTDPDGDPDPGSDPGSDPDDGVHGPSTEAGGCAAGGSGAGGSGVGLIVGLGLLLSQKRRRDVGRS